MAKRSNERNAQLRAGTPEEVAKALRAAFTDKEWPLFQSRLTGAVKAFQLVRQRAPEVAEWFVGRRRAATLSEDELSAQSRVWVQQLIGGLITLEQGQHDIQAPDTDADHAAREPLRRRAMLKVVSVNARGSSVQRKTRRR